MNYFLIITLATAASAAQLDNVYLPPHSDSSSRINDGLQTPFSSSGASQQYQSRFQGENEYAPAAGNQLQNQAEILSYVNEQSADGYHYAFETSDGTKVDQQGRVIPGVQPEEGSLQVTGSYSYIGDDGQTYTVTYTADENGFQPQGAHLPTPPPIPEEIWKSLQVTAGHAANYDSGKSSYDADNNGYKY